MIRQPAKAQKEIGVTTQNLHKIAWIPALIIKALYYRVKASDKLPGKSFDSYGRKISFLFLLKGKPKIFLSLLLNPVSIVRYFEFAFALESTNWASMRKCLDVSSPRLFFIYLLKKFPSIQFDIINPDVKDIGETKEYLDVLKLKRQANVVSREALHIHFPDNSYDIVTSISVLEHVPDDEDMLVIRKLWNLLKSGGRLIITVPCAQSYFEEWRQVDVYGQGNPEKDGNYFFQRIYDLPTLRKRVIEVIGTEPVLMTVFGEKEKGIYEDYERRWAAHGLRETVLDPYHIVSDYRYFSGIEDLKGIGVCGLIFEKGA
jgi:predicted SAM-dependent methyltransferase